MASERGAPDYDSTRELIEHNHLLTELTRHPGWGILTALAVESIGAYEKRLTSGRLDDLHEYKFIAGWLDGARQLLAIPQTVGERLERLQRAERERVEADAEPEYAASQA